MECGTKIGNRPIPCDECLKNFEEVDWDLACDHLGFKDVGGEFGFKCNRCENSWCETCVKYADVKHDDKICNYCADELQEKK
jgi:hypothetical protein